MALPGSCPGYAAVGLGMTSISHLPRSQSVPSVLPFRDNDRTPRLIGAVGDEGIGQGLGSEAHHDRTGQGRARSMRRMWSPPKRTSRPDSVHRSEVRVHRVLPDGTGIAIGDRLPHVEGRGEMVDSKMTALGSTQARKVASPRQLMKGLGKETLARCGGCGHPGEEHRNRLSCTVPICTCTGYFSMDRILPQGAQAVAVRLPAQSVMVTSTSGSGRESSVDQLRSWEVS
jgi:hypothetical protein